MRNARRSLIAVLLVLAAASARADDFFLEDGDRVVFYGDSITDQRLYTNCVETFVLTRFPTRKIEFVHSGWGGDRVGGGLGGPIDARLARDVVAHSPTVVTVMLGMNDGAYKKLDDKILATFSSGMDHIVGTIKSKLPKTRITLIEPSPYDDVTRKPGWPGGYNASMLEFGKVVRDLARREGLAATADLNAPVVAMLEKANEKDPALAAKLIGDRVHPGAAAHLVMAEALLRAWKAPSVVSSVEIEAASGETPTKIVSAKNTSVRMARPLAWTQEDKALPFALDLADPQVALVVSCSTIASLDEQILRVRGLTGPHALKIDGKRVVTLGASEWERGVNLALLPTPMVEQAKALHALTARKVNTQWVRWRQVQVPLADHSGLESYKRSLDALVELEADLVREQRALAQPKPHRYELVPIL